MTSPHDGLYFDANSTLAVPADQARGPDIDALVALHARYGLGAAMVHADPEHGVSAAEANRRLAAAVAGRPNLHFSWLLMPESAGAAADEQIAAMEAAGAAAARFLPRRYDFPFDQATVGSLLEALARRRVPTFLDGERLSWNEDVYDWDELGAICRAFPDLPLVLTRCSAKDPSALYPLWESGANLYAETSFYVVADGLADACRRGFAGRLLLGSGLPAWDAACPLTALRYADIDEEAFARIAGDNLRRLLGLPAVRAGRPAPPQHGYRVLDAHGHFGPSDDVHIPVRTADRLVELLDRHGIARLFVSSTHVHLGGADAGNQAVAAAIRRHPRRLGGYFRPDVGRPATLSGQLTRAIDRWGMIGLKLHCAWDQRGIEHPDYAPVLQFAEERRLPVLVHGIDPPEAFARVCRRYPHLRVLIAHQGGRPLDEAAPWMQLTRELPNCWLDMCWTRCYRGALAGVVQAFGPQKLLFATDFAFNGQAFAMGRVLGADLPPDIKRQLLYENAAEFFGLTGRDAGAAGP